MAIENHPRLEDGSPFPTLFWLTCPMLVKRVSTLEADGAMATVNEVLARDAELRRRLGEAIERYARRRDDHERIDTDSPPGGGPDRVKCLHAHAAHELSDGPNAIGARALTATGWPDCIAPCVPKEIAAS